MSSADFDNITDVYDALIDWPKRLANEEPFFRRLFERVGAERVLDAACGTGRHAELFHSWGLSVEGADISAPMIDLARARCGDAEGLNWALRGFDRQIDPPGSFNAAVCTGNSLALAPDAAVVLQTVRALFGAVRSGGAIVLHVLNLWRLHDGPCLWQKCKRAELQRGEVLIIKGVQRTGNRGWVNLLVAPLDAPGELQAQSTPFLGFEALELEEICRAAGASSVQIFGGYQEQPYEREASVDLIVTALK